MKQFGNPNFGTFFILIFVQMKRIKALSCSLFKDLINKINIFVNVQMSCKKIFLKIAN
jgi:hypothetical protein